MLSFSRTILKKHLVGLIFPNKYEEHFMKLLSFLLKNKYTNSLLAYLCATIIFISAIVLSSCVGVMVLSFITVFFAGGVALSVMQWFDKKMKEGK